MTFEQAHKILTEHTRNYIPLCDRDALEVAIKAVEKRIPQSVLREDWDDFIYLYRCPSCRVRFLQKKRYCGSLYGYILRRAQTRSIHHCQTLHPAKNGYIPIRKTLLRCPLREEKFQEFL